MKDAERREKNRLRSERWRRAHGIMPRRPAQRPWLEAGCTKARQQACLAATFERAEAFMRQLQAELAEAAWYQATAAAIICEFVGGRQ
jgi:hypothetical protein